MIKQKYICDQCGKEFRGHQDHGFTTTEFKDIIYNKLLVAGSKYTLHLKFVSSKENGTSDFCLKCFWIRVFDLAAKRLDELG